MKPLRTLIGLYLNGVFRISVIRHSRDARERRQAIFGIVAVGTVAIVYGGMSGAMTAQMLTAGIEAYVPILMTASTASLFTLATAFAQGSAALSGFSDLDTLLCMPIKTSAIVLARLFSLYFTEAVTCFAYLIPCGAVYAILAQPDWRFYAAFPVTALLLPVVPTVLGSGADLLLSAAFARSRHRKGVTAAVKMIVLIGFVVLAYLFPQMGEQFMTAPQRAAETAERIYPPAQWFARGATGEPALAALFVLGSAAIGAMFVLVLDKTLLPLHDRSSAEYHAKGYRLGALKRSGVLMAMVTIERRRFFSSAAWVVNTVFGSVLIAVLGVAGAALSGKLAPILRDPAVKSYAVPAVAGALTFCATVSPTTSCAISMEGKALWISKTLPVSAKRWLSAKLLLNLLLVGPSLLLATVLLLAFYRDRLDPLDMLGIVLPPFSSLLFATALGLFVNAKMPRLSGKSDTEVVKQSGPVLVMLLTGIGLVGLTALPTLLSGKIWLMIGFAAAIFCAAAAAYLHLMKNAEQIRRNL